MLYNTSAIAEHPPQLLLQGLNFSILNTTAFFIHLKMTRIRPFFLKVSWVFPNYLVTAMSNERACQGLDATWDVFHAVERPQVQGEIYATALPCVLPQFSRSPASLQLPKYEKDTIILSVKLSDSRMTWNKGAKLTNQRKTATGSDTEVNPISCSAFFNFDRPGKSVTWIWKQGAPLKHLTLEISVSIISVSIRYGNLTRTSNHQKSNWKVCVMRPNVVATSVSSAVTRETLSVTLFFKML